jgi:hypothetical protein
MPSVVYNTNARTISCTLADNPLLLNTTYVITVTGIADARGNVMPTPFELTFTTAGDITAPRVVSTTPANNASGVVATSRTDGVDESTVFLAIGDGANRHRFTQRDVDCPLKMIAHVAIGQVIDVGFDHAFGPPQLRLVGDIADRAADRSRAEQRALRPAQSFHAVEVEKVKVRSEQ